MFSASYPEFLILSEIKSEWCFFVMIMSKSSDATTVPRALRAAIDSHTWPDNSCQSIS